MRGITVGKLIEQLEKLPTDAKIVATSEHSTLDVMGASMSDEDDGIAEIDLK